MISVVALLYGIVVCIATFLGAFVGLGGGVVIKPVLDVIGAHPLEQISFISSCAVFAMSITSMAKHIRNKTPIKPFIVLLVAAGSVAGGICGNTLFAQAMQVSGRPELVKGVQSAILAFFLACVILSVVIKHRTFHVTNPLAILFAGFLLGTAAFGHWRRADQCSVFNALFFLLHEGRGGLFCCGDLFFTVFQFDNHRSDNRLPGLRFENFADCNSVRCCGRIHRLGAQSEM